jgi:hypothetical protein
MRWGCGLLLVLLLGSCASVQQQSVVTTPVRQSLVAGLGDTVLRVESSESLPNVIGRADIFGRTRPTGFTTIQYGGLRGNKAVLLRNGVVTQSNATTYSRHASQTSVSTQQPTIPVVVDWRVDPRVPILGQTIVIEAANSISLTYHIE